MSLNLNRVSLAGHLTRFPELRKTTRSPVASFSVAINRRWKQGEETREEVTFVDCEAWGRTAELICQYLGKGSPIYLEGRLKLDQWEDKDGKKRSRLQVVAENVQFLPSTRRGDTEQGNAEATTSEGAETDAEPVAAGMGGEPPF